MTEAEIEANTFTDPDNPQWTDAELQAAELVLPGEDPKVPVSIRLDSEVLDYFKQGGRGYQSRINAVLLGYVRTQQRKSMVAEPPMGAGERASSERRKR